MYMYEESIEKKQYKAREHQFGEGPLSPLPAPRNSFDCFGEPGWEA